ncbi:MAG: hypothetical protein IT259_04095 [Saprospiraceae bacterium]|nr:hypothetical protein [Saprospiraceae bacterium]
MSNRGLLILLVSAIVVLGALFWYFRNPDRARYDWSDSWGKKTYAYDSDQPYGTEVLHRLLDRYFPGKKMRVLNKDVASELPVDSLGSAPASYVFVGEGMYMDSAGTAQLLNFVAAGNTALISSKTIPFDLMTYVYPEECDYDLGWSDYENESDTMVAMTLAAPPVPPTTFYYVNRNIIKRYNWNYIPDYIFCDSIPAYPLGRLDSLVNFAEFPVGKGRFLLHTSPIAFSNFHLLRPEARRYAEAILSYLPEGDIYWDDVSRVPEQVARRQNNSGRDLPEEHLLTWLLQQPALAWAWYLLLGMAGIYLVFRARRRQRIIPILPKNENSSYEFISTIANLHFRDRNYRGLCLQSMKLFLAQVRERYGIVAPLDTHTGIPKVDGEFFRRLSENSEIPESQIRDIFTQYNNTIQYEPTEAMMVDLYLAMEAFFKKAK